MDFVTFKNSFTSNVLFLFSATPAMEVVSRQRILSRSRDDLNDYEDEDVWYDLDELVKVK